MKIIHLVIGKGNPDRPNGVNRVAYNSAKYQKLAGHDVSIWGITATPNGETYEHNYSLRLFQNKSKLRRFSLDPALKQAIKELSEPTVFHFQGVFIPEFYAVARLLKKYGHRWVVAPHGAYIDTSMKHNALVKKIFLRFFDRYILQNALALHAAAPGVNDAIKSYAPNLREVIIPYGQNFEDLKFTPTPIERPHRPVFSYCGRFARAHKGLDIMIDAFALYKQKGGTGVLWMIGNGPDEDFIRERVAQHNLQESVLFLGPMYGEEKANRHHWADIFVHTSRWDVLPLSVLEAAGIGTPLLVTV